MAIFSFNWRHSSRLAAVAIAVGSRPPSSAHAQADKTIVRIVDVGRAETVIATRPLAEDVSHGRDTHPRAGV